MSNATNDKTTQVWLRMPELYEWKRMMPGDTLQSVSLGVPITLVKIRWGRNRKPLSVTVVYVSEGMPVRVDLDAGDVRLEYNK